MPTADATVVLVGTLDTKGREYAYLREVAMTENMKRFKAIPSRRENERPIRRFRGH
jgi:uncharacterized protein (UPF0261 family)